MQAEVESLAAMDLPYDRALRKNAGRSGESLAVRDLLYDRALKKNAGKSGEFGCKGPAVELDYIWEGLIPSFLILYNSDYIVYISASIIAIRSQSVVLS